MSNPIGRSDDVASATDKLLQSLLEKAAAADATPDFALAVVQAATRWTAVKNRMSVPDEGNTFDEWRGAIAGTGPAAEFAESAASLGAAGARPPAASLSASPARIAAAAARRHRNGRLSEPS